VKIKAAMALNFIPQDIRIGRLKQGEEFINLYKKVQFNK